MDKEIRILIVEDLPTDATLAQRAISKDVSTCSFQVVDTREEYLAALDKFKPDIIISDYRLPQFDGLSALRIALERTPLTPLIMLTGSLNEDTAVACMKAGASDYVIKEHIKRLGPAIIRALEEKQVRRERREAEIALRESEERFRSLYENATIGIYRASPDGNILMANPAAVRMLGFESLEELAQNNREDGKLQSIAQKVEVREKLEKEGILQGMEICLYKNDGTPVFVRENIRAIRNEAGKVIFYDGTFEDITATKLADERIRHEAARAATLLRIASRLNTSLDLRQSLTAICEETANALDVPLVNVYLYDSQTNSLTSAMAVGMPEEEYLALPKFSLSVVDKLKKGPSSILLWDTPEIIEQLEIDGLVTRDYRSTAIALIQEKNQIVGALLVTSVG
ncbi:MAG: response regulator, partial [Anaerolineaceae bacterium]